MNNVEKEIVKKTEKYVFDALIDEPSGHDWWHILRVVNSTKKIAGIEQEIQNVNLFICEMAALLHDIADEKLNENAVAGEQKVKDWLKEVDVNEADQAAILTIILNMSYKGGTNKVRLKTIEGKIVQDADRLDALGAVGIARTFTYSGLHERPIHDPRREKVREHLTLEEYRSGNDTAIMHFYEKLLKLKDLMQTKTGAQLALQRHQYMAAFLAEFYDEWEGKC
ncbi:HD domain-containing protein [Carnobacterium gallinarum]|uniref:HD domain-containing protein n=1 Tax=Carnobacterium gallinarum TaxID=2749 RepID=UPI00054FE387|nr:HD domain-containing protein [Carnobacterium gallinarum]